MSDKNKPAFMDKSPETQGNESEATLKARIAELERKLAEKPVSSPVPVGAVATPTGKQVPWEVSLLHQPTRIVLAADQANAWSAYCHTMGVIASEYQPVIVTTSQDRYQQQQDYLARLNGKN